MAPYSMITVLSWYQIPWKIYPSLSVLSVLLSLINLGHLLLHYLNANLSNLYQLSPSTLALAKDNVQQY